MLGIAPSQILLALSFAALLACGEKLRLPRIWLPLGLFLLGTVISLLLSDDPAAGLPQIRKFYVFLELLVVFSLLRSFAMVRLLFLTWAGIGALTAIRGCVQFAAKCRKRIASAAIFTSSTSASGSPASPATGTLIPRKRCSR